MPRTWTPCLKRFARRHVKTLIASLFVETLVAVALLPGGTLGSLALFQRYRHTHHSNNLQVFGFLLGIDLKGMGGQDEEGDDRMKDASQTPSSSSSRAPAEAKEADEEDEVRAFD